ncbi:14172_t:CDS:2, partial [Gigaspora rosea]
MSQQKKEPYGFDGKYMFSETDVFFTFTHRYNTEFSVLESYFLWTLEQEIVPRFSENYENQGRYQLLSDFRELASRFVPDCEYECRPHPSDGVGNLRLVSSQTASMSVVLIPRYQPDWSCVIEKIHRIQISESRREKTYIMYSNENDYVGNVLLEDQKKSELDTNNSVNTKTIPISRLTKRFLDVAKESSPKRLGPSIANVEISNNEQDLSNELDGDPYINSSHESDDSEHDGFISPTPCAPEDPFADEKIIIINVSSRIPSLNSDLDVFLDNVNISAKFRQYINEAISYANDKGLYVETNTHEILSLSSILVLIPNSYPTKMVEAFSLDVLESIHRRYTPKLSLQLDIEVENIYRKVIKTCLNDSRNNGIKLLCANIVQKDELIDNFGFLILDLIRTLPYNKIRNEPSELTLITNYLDNVMKNVFHVPDKHIVRWPNTTLTESKVRKFDGSRTKQPDFVVSVNYQSRATNVIFVGEVTGPTEKNNVYKNCLDLIRIGVFMKDCIDSAISQGVDIKILGFQCIAYKIDFYILDINGEGLYMMNHIAQISVPATIKDICSFIDELYILLNLRSILYESYNAFVDKLKNPRLAPLELKSSFKKPTLDTPEFNKLVSKTRCVKRECPFWFGRYKYVFSFQNNLKFTILILIAIVDDNNLPSEQNDKDTATENDELKSRVAKLEKKQSQTDEKNNFI